MIPCWRPCLLRPIQPLLAKGLAIALRRRVIYAEKLLVFAPTGPWLTMAAKLALQRRREKSPGGLVACRLAAGVECGPKGRTGR